MLLSLVAYMFAVFIPRSYDVPQMHKRKGTQYWDLHTGSKIAYSLVSAKGIKETLSGYLFAWRTGRIYF